jgi:hypothetical protein
MDKITMDEKCEMCKMINGFKCYKCIEKDVIIAKNTLKALKKRLVDEDDYNKDYFRGGYNGNRVYNKEKS